MHTLQAAAVAAAAELYTLTHLVVDVRIQRIYTIYLSVSGCFNWLKVKVDNVDIPVNASRLSEFEQTACKSSDLLGLKIHRFNWIYSTTGKFLS